MAGNSYLGITSRLPSLGYNAKNVHNSDSQNICLFWLRAKLRKPYAVTEHCPT